MVDEQSENTRVCRAIQDFGTSIFTEMTALSNHHQAVNLSQGFPDFDGPLSIKQAAAEAIIKGPNQYSPAYGVPVLRQAVADKMDRFYGVSVDPDSQVTVTTGATEGMAAALLGLLDPGDEVILIEPCYDLYPPIVSRAGAVAVYVGLERPDFSLDLDALARAFNSKTRVIVINNPQNPCGKVYSRRELESIADLCCEYDVVAVGDEVYEHLVYDEHRHVTLLQVPGLAERSIVVSSTGKTFSMTGWKVGFAVAAPELSRAVRMCHQFLTFSIPSALQEAMAHGISMGDDYYRQLLADYQRKRALLGTSLEGLGFDVLWPEGTYYLSIDISTMDFEDDLAFCHALTRDAGVATIPSSFFWHKRRAGKELVRFCFCKEDATLESAVRRLEAWKA